MKIILQIIFFSFLFSNVNYAQWSPTTTSTVTPIYRSGSVGIGMNTAPYAQFQVNQFVGAVIPGQEAGIYPTFRLLRDINTGSFDDGIHTWDLYANPKLSFHYGDGNYSTLAMNLSTNVLEVVGRKLVLGYGATIPEDNMNFGYTGNGHYITFNGTYNGDSYWGGTIGKAVIHSELDGSLYFLTQEQGGVIGFGKNRRLTLTPQGTAIFGDQEDMQVLSISSNLESVLRLQRKRSGPDFEMLRNDDGDLEFRGGQDGEGVALPSLMKLRKTGKLVIGTEDTPSSLDDNEIDISNYKLYVEGGILTKEIRVRTIWSDYVFAKDYDLVPLEAVEIHIKENGHLHNTPSGASIEKNGLELGSMMANQQEKIEEVYLHLIEMNKKLVNLEKENEALKIRIKQLEENH